MHSLFLFSASPLKSPSKPSVKGLFSSKISSATSSPFAPAAVTTNATAASASSVGMPSKGLNESSEASKGNEADGAGGADSSTSMSAAVPIPGGGADVDGAGIVKGTAEDMTAPAAGAAANETGENSKDSTSASEFESFPGPLAIGGSVTESTNSDSDSAASASAATTAVTTTDTSTLLPIAEGQPNTTLGANKVESLVSTKSFSPPKLQKKTSKFGMLKSQLSNVKAIIIEERKVSNKIKFCGAKFKFASSALVAFLKAKKLRIREGQEVLPIAPRKLRNIHITKHSMVSQHEKDYNAASEYIRNVLKDFQLVASTVVQLQADAMAATALAEQRLGKR